MAGQGPIPSAKPKVRKMSARSQVLSLDGVERPYPVYPFSRRTMFEKPRHNPFSGLGFGVEKFSDDFNRAGPGLGADYSVLNWYENTVSELQIITPGFVQQNADAKDSGMLYTGSIPLSPDHYSDVVLGNIDLQSFVLAVRCTNEPLFEGFIVLCLGGLGAYVINVKNGAENQEVISDFVSTPAGLPPFSEWAGWRFRFIAKGNKLTYYYSTTGAVDDFVEWLSIESDDHSENVNPGMYIVRNGGLQFSEFSFGAS